MHHYLTHTYVCDFSFQGLWSAWITVWNRFNRFWLFFITFHSLLLSLFFYSFCYVHRKREGEERVYVLIVELLFNVCFILFLDLTVAGRRSKTSDDGDKPEGVQCLPSKFLPFPLYFYAGKPATLWTVNLGTCVQPFLLFFRRFKTRI